MSFLSNAWLGRCLLAATLVGAYPVLAAASELPEVQRLVERRDFKQALVKVNQHLATRPDSLDGRFLKGVVLAESNDPTQAIAIFTQLTKDAPQMLEAYNNLGVLYARQQEYDKARATLEAALKVDPAFSAVAGNLRDTYGRLAKQAYDKALGQESAVPSGGKKLVLLSQLRAPSGNSDKAPEVAAGKLGASSLSLAPLTPALSPVVAALPAAAPATAPAPAPAPAAKLAPATKVVVASATPAAPAAELKVQAAPERKAPAPAALSPREKEVQRALDAWAEAWMRKDMKAYLAAYASDFKLPGKLSRKEWERERHTRIVGKKDRIQLVLEKTDIEVKGGVATAKFLQRYKAGSYSDVTRKTLTLARQGGKWRIKSEQ